MPTGYTAKIADDITFEEYALDCAKAFGMWFRDINGSLIDIEIKPSSYYPEQIIKTQIRLSELSAITDDNEWDKMAKKSHQDDIQYHRKSFEAKQQLKLKYDIMLKKCLDWQPPTEEHQALKKFMCKQIEESILFDCTSSSYENEPLLTGTEFKEQYIQWLIDELKYYEESYRDELQQVASANNWLDQLKDSLKND